MNGSPSTGRMIPPETSICGPCTKPWRIRSRVAIAFRYGSGKRGAATRAAARAFNERGFHNTSLDDIAAELGVTKPTLYYYFSDKAALFGALVHEAHDERYRLMRGAAGQAEDLRGQLIEGLVQGEEFVVGPADQQRFRAEGVAEALADRGRLTHGEVIMTREGHAVDGIAAATADPDEPPLKMPSSRTSRRAIRNDSRSFTCTTSSIKLKSSVLGMKSSPMPSIL